MENRDEYLSHHGILGQKWGRRMGPPYPLSRSNHSAAERKAGWEKSLKGSPRKEVNVPAGGGGGGKKEEELEDWEKTLYEDLKKTADRISKDPLAILKSQSFKLTLAEAGVDVDKFTDAQIEQMRKKAFSHYLKSDNSSSVSKVNKALESEKEYRKNEVELKRDQKARNTEKEKVKDESLKKLYADLKGDNENILKDVVNDKGKNKDGSDYDSFKVALYEAGVDIEELGLTDNDIEQMRKEAQEHYGKKQSSDSSGSTIQKKAQTKTAKENVKNASLKMLYSDLKRQEGGNEKILKDFINDKGTNSDGSSYDSFKVALYEAGIDIEELGLTDNDIEDMRKKAQKYYSSKESVTHSALRHYGILGMHWGVQNGPPYPIGSAKRNSMKMTAKQKAKSMTDKELDDAINRMKKEQEYLRLSSESVKKGKGIVRSFLDKAASSFADSLSDKVGKAATATLMNEVLDPTIFRVIYTKK